MKVLVDTSVWSLAFRRRGGSLNPDEQRTLERWKALVNSGAAVLMGPIRQELLSGIPHHADFDSLLEVLSSFEEIPVLSADYVMAARFFNRCRSKGISGTFVDLLICAVAHRTDLPIFAHDRDFDRYAEHLPIRLLSLSETPTIPSV